MLFEEEERGVLISAIVDLTGGIPLVPERAVRMAVDAAVEWVAKVGG